ncbi:MAG: hypothetical protein UX30_C0016G0005 [Candidatus Saccharibacteria bacterium GW2011_GWA2_46_10]|nr:MAG: hypothetical protein UX30_C0016G0005 [Candidatus Saccharibacteria bacterium GW2011_GWA2_46_10]
MFSAIHDPKILIVWQKAVKQETEKDREPSIKLMYEILANLFVDNAVFDAEWFKEKAKKYHLPNLQKIKSETLFVRENGNRGYSFNWA